MWIVPEFDTEIKVNDQTKNKSKNTLWIDDAKPITSSDLAVHKKKVQEVNTWINDHIKGLKLRKFLLLTGPPGSGKSATLDILCKESNLEIREWINEDKQDYVLNQDNWMNQSDQFSHFLNKSSKYDTLFHSNDGQNKPLKSIILVQEFPPIFTKSPLEFHSILRKYNNRSSCPIVFIISDVNDNKSILKQFFPSELQEELSVTNIVFNTVATSILLNALNRISNMKVKDNSLKKHCQPSKQYLQSIVEKSGGDIRSAINSFQFSLSETTSSETTRKRDKHVTDSELNTIGCKDTKLLIFRSLGKILYCKRKAYVDDKPPSLPSHLMDEERLQLVEDPEEVFERSGTDASNLSLFLHHNCSHFFKDIHAMSRALEYITDSNILLSHWNPDSCLEGYGASLCTRGLMHNLPYGSGGQSFRALTRPEFYKSKQKSVQRLQQAKQLCKMVECSDTELLCNLIPMSSKINYASNNRADNLLREIGLIYPVPVSKSSSVVSSNVSILNASIDTEDTLKTDEDLVEDFIIEEFED